MWAAIRKSSGFGLKEQIHRPFIMEDMTNIPPRVSVGDYRFVLNGLPKRSGSYRSLLTNNIRDPSAEMTVCWKSAARWSVQPVR